jgi:RNA polymerase sigma-70 factor (TIGR02960 family)
MHRRELHVHAYRMLGSFEEAEDAVQETYLRAWRSRDGFDDRTGYRAWLYRIVTNVCLDAIRRRKRRPIRTLSELSDVPWLQPYPDRLLDEAARSDTQPELAALDRETIELAFIAALQLLSPRQRAAFVLSDIIDMPTRDVAAHLGMTTAAVNSALQRARATLRANPPHGRSTRPPSAPSEEELRLLRRFMVAHERVDIGAMAALLREDAIVAMPPRPHAFVGRDMILASLVAGLDDWGTWHLVPVAANRQPAAACYLRRPGEDGFTAYKVDVVRFELGLVAEITTFNARLFPAFGLPPTLPPASGTHGVTAR